MNVKRRTVFGVVLALAAVWLAIAWIADPPSPTSGFAEVVIRCDGSPEERVFLVDEHHVELVQGFRRLIAVDGLVVYKILIDDCSVEQVKYNVNRIGYDLDGSPDGKKWQRLFHYVPTDIKGDVLQVVRCGLSPEMKAESARRGTIYCSLRGR